MFRLIRIRQFYMKNFVHKLSRNYITRKEEYYNFYKLNLKVKNYIELK